MWWWLVTWKSVVACCTLLAQLISRTECMLSCAQPTSTVARPSLAAMIGPIVLPHGESLRTTKSYQHIMIQYYSDYTRDGQIIKKNVTPLSTMSMLCQINCKTLNIYTVWTTWAFATNQSQFKCAHLCEKFFTIIVSFLHMQTANQTVFYVSLSKQCHEITTCLHRNSTCLNVRWRMMSFNETICE